MSSGWAALLLYAALTAVLGNQLIGDLPGRLYGYSVSDNFYNVWYLWRFKQAVETGQNPAYTHLIFALLPSVQVFVEFWIADVLGFILQHFMGVVAAYNIIILLGFVLSGLTMYLLAGEFAESWLSRFSAGFLYTFSTYHFYKAVAHVGVQTIEWLPFCAWRIFVFYRRPTVFNAVLAGVGLALVPLSEIYYLGYFLIPFMTLFAAWKLVTDVGWFTHPKHLLLAGVAAAVALAIAGPPLTEYLHLSASMGARMAVAAKSTVRYSADLLAFVLPNPTNPFVGSWTAPIYAHMRSNQLIEEAVFLGYPAMALSIFAVVSERCRRAGAPFWFVCALAGVVLALGPKVLIGGHPVLPGLAYRALYGWSTVFDAFRAPDRIAVMTVLATSVLSALAIDDLLRRAGHRWTRVALLAVIGLLLVVSLAEGAVYSVALPSIPVQVPRVYSQIAKDKSQGLVLEVPILLKVMAPQYSFYQTVHHHPEVNGYVSRLTSRMYGSVERVPFLRYLDPTNHLLSRGPLRPDRVHGSRRFRRVLEVRNIRYVILNDWAFTPGQFARVHQFLRLSLGAPFYVDPVQSLYAWKLEPVARG